MKFSLLTTLPLLFALPLAAQQDTLRRLPEVEVKSYLSKESLLRIPTAVSVLSPRQLSLQQGASLVPAFNHVAGVRMEERSPGSYRLSIRGSLLRSPFGVRNVKVYMDELPLTDAGGNTYLNLLDPSVLSSAEVLKGPDGSLFGANSGGVVRLDVLPPPGDSTCLQASVQGGSYGLFHAAAGYRQQLGNYGFQLFQGYQQSDGYRQNTAMRRSYTQLGQRWEYKPGYTLKMLGFYADLGYRTPGGLTLAQLDKDPRAARPATATLPGAVAQKAGIYNRTVQGGLVHEAQFSPRWQHVVAVFGENTHFENPFITNYESRDENTAGFRTYLSWMNKPSATLFQWKWQAGMEWQRTVSDIINYGNNRGARDTIQVADKLTAGQYFYFTRFHTQLHRWTLEAAASMNYYHCTYNRNGNTKVAFTPQLMPRVSLSYLINDQLTGRVSVSRGYSPPATAEVRASDNIINTALRPETGWNYEAGLRLLPLSRRYSLDVTGFHYRMKDAIVRKLRDNGAEFFVNAGGVNQTGVEAEGMLQILQPRTRGFIRGLEWRSSYTWSDFYFRDYVSSGKDFSGNRVTGVPRSVVVSGMTVYFPKAVYVYVAHNFTSSIPLNDANSAYARGYHLMQCKAAWQLPISGKCKISVQAGADNLLNQSYSLGNDLNAVGERYYNPAPGRTYFGGIQMVL
ncbi:TonB-dependent receptor [Chitinophaga qingshengii]|uniref:TonB-dependent receptor n=1 Tax=Chitinophaga qingshengii TaxID=1569794 RepID=A0ABR7TY80_9BACT|nr:TonB-dependent receptor [Chitinophaga qingshengii]MBC9935058.1 TonB-dependent receptor [Chitinophaga qingshengii]